MIEVYGIKIDPCMDNEIFDNFLIKVSFEKREKIKKFKFFQDAQRCLFGDLLARYVICKISGVNNKQLEFGENEYGKPILVEPPNLHFNISHSGDWVLCAVGNEPVGIDVEVIKPIDFDIAKRFFSTEEHNKLMSKEEKERLKYFYLLWTLKESYIKAVGKGLSIPLNSFSFNIENNNIRINTRNDFNNCFFMKYEIDKNHLVAVCSLNKDFVPDIIEVNLLQFFSLN